MPIISLVEAYQQVQEGPPGEHRLVPCPVEGHGLATFFKCPDGKARVKCRSARCDYKAIREAVGQHVEVIGTSYKLTYSSDRRGRPTPKWLVEGVIPDQGVGQMFGASNSGKTLLALDLALCLVNGKKWLNLDTEGTGQPVVYIAMEGVWGLQARVDAWVAGHPGTSDDELVTIEDEPINLADPASITALSVELIGAGIAPSLIVVDTQGMATPTTDENSNSEMNLVYRNVKRLSHDVGCAIVVIHHSGHDETRARGASAQKQALDFELKVAKDEKEPRGSMTVKKERDAESGQVFGFEFVPTNGSVYVRPGVVLRRMASTEAMLDDAYPNAITVQQVVECTGASEKKARGDLQKLADQGKAIRVPGGRIRGKQAPDEYTATDKLRRQLHPLKPADVEWMNNYA